MSLKTVYLSLQWGCMSMIACELSLAFYGLECSFQAAENGYAENV